jgi:ABC-type glycerol-3-phosphate transport system permease component
MEMEITWARATRVWWSYLWRSLLMAVGGFIGGAVVGGIIGFAMALAGASVTTIQFVTAPIGLLLGLGLSIIPVKLILGKNFGEFRLVLVSTQAQPSQSTPPNSIETV